MPYIEPYTKKDGTQVRGHPRRNPSRGARATRTNGPPASGFGIAIGALIILALAGWGYSNPDAPGGDMPAWSTAGLTVSRISSSDESTCDSHSYGQVQKFFEEHDCAALHRDLLKAEDHQGNSALIATSHIKMASSEGATSLKGLTDRNDSGNVNTLAADTYIGNNVSFTGQHYASSRKGAELLVAEAEPLTGSINSATLKILAEHAIKRS